MLRHQLADALQIVDIKVPDRSNHTNRQHTTQLKQVLDLLHVQLDRRCVLGHDTKRHRGNGIIVVGSGGGNADDIGNLVTHVDGGEGKKGNLIILHHVTLGQHRQI